MTNPTSNFGWQMPTSTDLVTDLPADFAVFGQAVDTSMADLKGGTTGQILSKATNTDMDFTWVTNDVGDITAVTAGTGITGGGTTGAVTITNDMATTITTNGDLLYGTGSGTYTRRGIGSTGNVLTVSGGVPVWSAPAAGGKVLQVVSATTLTEVSTSSATYADSNLTATITPSSASSKILVLVSQNGCRATGQYGGVRLVRGATTISQMDTYLGYAAGGTAQVAISANYLDSPATTSATTYKTQINNSSGSPSFKVQTDNVAMSMITLLEIGA